MPSNAISGVGASFKRSDMASSPAFTSIAEVNNITGPSMSRDTIDVTSLDSTGGYREFIGGFRDGGTIQFNMNFSLAGYNDMKDDFESDSLRDYQIVLPDSGATTFDFSGLVTELPLDVPMDDKITCAVTIKISGPVTLST
jgi:predicted secreted protein